MTEKTGSRQEQILSLLLNAKSGLSIDEIAEKLAVSRTAAQQHVDKLVRDGYVKMGAINKTAGRPVRLFVLTEAGINRFPKQYAWFSELMLDQLHREFGSDGLERYLDTLAQALAAQLSPRFSEKQLAERLAELIRIMNELGFQARFAAGSSASIEAVNCIYHDLAQKYPEVCTLDRSLIRMLLDRDIDHTECMAKGGGVCRFVVKP